MAPAGVTRSLQETPTWALATVIFTFIAVSIFIEHLIEQLCNWLRRHRKTALFEAVEKLKSVLMLLGFMSLILAVTQKPVSKICIPTKIAYTMLPCRRAASTKTSKSIGFDEHLWTEDVFEDVLSREERSLAATTTTTNTYTSTTYASSDYCQSKGMTSLITEGGMTQLSIFIFALAVMQIVYSVITMALGKAKMKRWKSWEKETQTVEYQAAVDPNRFRFTRQTTFGRRHMSNCTGTSFNLWIKCFFRQFFHSVAKVDYLTLRHGFISAHLPSNSSFNFQKYIQRSLEDDFKVVVGISPVMWFLVVIFLLVDVHGWHVYLWVSFLPLITVLVLGTKLEVVVARMALRLKEGNSVIKGAPIVEPNDNLFWFGDPKFVLTLLHFTLFMNAFELAFFVWVTLQFGIKSCYHERLEIIIIRVVLAVTVQVMCSYITLPLYALVTQMGSQFKSAVLEEQTATVIKKWYAGARKNRKKQEESSVSGHGNSSSPVSGHGNSSSPVSGHGNSSTTTKSSHTSSSPDFSSHHRAPSLSEISPSRSLTDIIEDCHEIEPHKPAGLSMVSSSSTVIQIELGEVRKEQT